MSRPKTEPSPMVAGVITGGVSAGVVKKALSAGADSLELRVDTFGEQDPGRIAQQIKGLKSQTKKTALIITVRSFAEGGESRLSDKDRAKVFETLIPYADFLDIELRSAKRLKNVISSAKRANKKVILSYHNFSSTPGPSRLNDIVKKGRKAGGDIVKVAAAANSAGDFARLARLCLDHKGLIVIAMGERGAPSRVFFPMLGSLVTYGSITKKTAPGQMPIRKLKKELALYGF